MVQRNLRSRYPNPFYVVLLVVSTAFVVTVLGYLIAPGVQLQAAENPHGGPGATSRALAVWFERWGQTALGIELGVMLLSGLLAMAFEHRFSPKRVQKPSNSSLV